MWPKEQLGLNIWTLLNNQNGALIKSDEFILNSTGSQCKKDPALVNTAILAKTPTPQYHEEDSLLTHKHNSPKGVSTSLA